MGILLYINVDAEVKVSHSRDADKNLDYQEM